MKKVISCLLAVLMIFTIIPMATVNVSAAEAWWMPLISNYSIGDPFGCTCSVHNGNHKGQDFPASYGTTVRATKSGTVIESYSGCNSSHNNSGDCGGYGKHVKIRHNDGTYSLYAHLSSVSVSYNQTVNQGQKVGGVGTTGWSSGNHLHFEIYNASNVRVNPMNYVNPSNPSPSSDTTPPYIDPNRVVVKKTNTGYSIGTVISDNVGVTSVKFPTWHAGLTGNQAKWIQGSFEGTYCYWYCNVNISDWNNYYGNYTTHIYAYDAAGNSTMLSVGWVNIENNAPIISDTTYTLTDTGYQIKCKVTDENAISKVQFPTWTTYNGQDDLNSSYWPTDNKFKGKSIGDGYYTFDVNIADHNNEKGTYITDIYAYDDCGNISTMKRVIVDLSKPATTSLSNCTITLAYTSTAYNGTALTPSVTVKNGSTTLIKNSDYTVTYSNNKNVGTATVTITGIGDYTGTVTKTFEITKEKISSCSITLPYTSTAYSGTALTPSVTVKNGSTTLIKNTDYTVTYSNNKSVGTATVTITGIGDYTGTVTKTFEITKEKISSCSITLEYTSTTYSTKAKTPKVTVKDNSSILIKNTDYTVTYSKNVNAGTATVTIFGKGNYTGNTTKIFTIKRKSFNDWKEAKTVEMEYPASNIKSYWTMTLNGYKLVEGKDYTVSTEGEIKVGNTVKVIYSGINNFIGDNIYTFTIVCTNHKYGNWIVSKESTCTSTGKKYKYCSICNKVVTEIIPKMEHSIIYGEGYREETYFQTGYTGDDLCQYCGTVIYSGRKISKLKLKTPKFTINAGKKLLKIKYYKVTNATGFEIKYKIGNTGRTIRVMTKSSQTLTIYKLKKGSYKVQIRAFIKSGNKYAYSNWTSIKTAKVK